MKLWAVSGTYEVLDTFFSESVLLLDYPFYSFFSHQSSLFSGLGVLSFRSHVIANNQKSVQISSI